MRVAVVSDIHGNLTALEAVLADVKQASPDVIVHGGDLVGSGARPAEVVRLYTRSRVAGRAGECHIRRLPSFTVANSGSVSLSYDGDRRAAYVLVDDDQMTIRRVEYDVEREAQTLLARRYPDAAWLETWLRTGAAVPPPG